MFQLSKATMEFLREHDPVLHEQMCITFAPRPEVVFAPPVKREPDVTYNFYVGAASATRDDDIIEGEYVFIQ